MDKHENQSVKERLKTFIMFKNISTREFERKIGTAYGFIGNMSKSTSPEKIMRIHNAFPELNTDWLMTGEGEMLRNEAGEKVESSADRTDKLIESNLELIRQSAELIQQQGELIKQQGDLIGLLKKLSN